MEMVSGYKYLPGSKLELTIIPCPICHETHTLIVDQYAFENYADGVVTLREAFPEKTPPELELLISGIDGDCWNRQVTIPEEQ